MANHASDAVVWLVLALLGLGVYSLFFRFPILFFAALAETGSVVLHPSHWAFYVFVLLLVATVDHEYFPTAGLITGYMILMLSYGQFSWTIRVGTVVWFVVGLIIYLTIGGVWLLVKWWSFLRDPKNAASVRAVKAGEGTAFFFSKISYLYPHFLYWPFSMPHTLLTRLVYQIFEAVVRRFGNTFGQMVETRSAELTQK